MNKDKLLKLDNRGFAITTILFGTLILFMLLLVSLLGILSIYKNNLQKLVDDENGARNNVVITSEKYDSLANLKAATQEKGLYCINDECKYYSSNDLK